MNKRMESVSGRRSATTTREGVRREDLRAGDLVFVRTQNSTYRLRRLGDTRFLATGGWFDQEGVAPARVEIVGCSWGGTAIDDSMVAAKGMCLEFGNRLVTSIIRSVCVLRNWALN